MSHHYRSGSGSRRWHGHVSHPGLYVILEGTDVTFFLYDDAERRSQRNIPSSLWYQDFSQISLLLHLEACAETGDVNFHAIWKKNIWRMFLFSSYRWKKTFCLIHLYKSTQPTIQVWFLLHLDLPIVALSVSISASKSPSLNFSPTFFSQRCTVPIVMVGESAGSAICSTQQSKG